MLTFNSAHNVEHYGSLGPTRCVLRAGGFTCAGGTMSNRELHHKQFRSRAKIPKAT